MDFRTPAELGEQIASLRKARGLEVGMLAEEAEIEEAALIRIEAGQRDLGAGELARLAETLETSTEELLIADASELERLREDDTTISDVRKEFDAAIADYFAAMAISKYL